MTLFAQVLRAYLPTWSPEGIGHLTVGLISCGTLLYTWRVLKPGSPGLPKLLAAVPPVAANCVAPFVYRACLNGAYCNNSILYIAFLSWWTNFKILALCINRGPLPKSHSFFRFVTTMFLPINIREPAKVKADDVNASMVGANKNLYRSPFAKAANKYMHLTAKLVSVSGFAYTTHRFWNDMTPLQWDINLTFIMYLNLALQSDVCALIASTLVGVDLEAGMNEPYLSASLGEFWGKRWNLTASTTLRHLVYDPIAQSSLVAHSTPAARRPKPPSAGRRAVALLASFAVSGLYHEFIIWFATGGRYLSWEWFCFFVLQGVACCAEAEAKRQWRRRGWQPLPRALAVPLTLAFLLSTAEWLFYPPVIRSRWSEEGVNKLRLQLVWLGLIPDSEAAGASVIA